MKKFISDFARNCRERGL